MEKMLLNEEPDLEKAINFFGIKYKEEIKKAITSYPCVLIGHYSEDIEFGDGYDFTSVNKNDFIQKP